MRGEIVIRAYCMKNCIFNKNLKRFFILGLCAFLFCFPSYPVFSWNRYITEKTCKFSSLFISCAILNFFFLLNCFEPQPHSLQTEQSYLSVGT